MATAATDDRSILGSGHPEAQEEAKADAIERIGEEEYYADPELYWTAQQGPMPETGTVAANEPQKYLEEQLPDPAAAEAAGLAPQRIPATQIMTVDDMGHPQGPEPGELVRLGMVEVGEPEPVSDTVPEGNQPDETWTKADIQAWADDRGYEGVNQHSQNKDEMLEAIAAAD